MFARFLAAQLARPSGVLTALALGRVWNRRNRALNDAACAALDPQPDDRILEVGFGGGYLLERLAARVTRGSVVGLDISAALVARARRRCRGLVRAGRFDLLCGAADALPFAPAAFTKICSVNSAFYWPALAGPLAGFYRVLVPAGRIVLCLTHRASLESKGFARHGLRLYEPADVNAALQRAGFDHVQSISAKDRHRSFFWTAATKPAADPAAKPAPAGSAAARQAP